METTNNFMQIKEQTFEQKVEMYMQCDKKKLAEMLAMRDMIDEQKNKEKENIVEPYFPNKSSLPYWYNKCNPIVSLNSAKDLRTNVLSMDVY